MAWDVEAEMNNQTREAEMIFLGEINVDLERMDGQGWDEYITAAVATARQEYILV